MLCWRERAPEALTAVITSSTQKKYSISSHDLPSRENETVPSTTRRPGNASLLWASKSGSPDSLRTLRMTTVLYQEVSSAHMASRRAFGCSRFLLLLLSHLIVSDSVRPCEMQPTRLPCPWDSLGRSTGVGSHALLQGIFLTQGSNPGLLHCRQILYCWATREALLESVKQYLLNQSKRFQWEIQIT